MPIAELFLGAFLTVLLERLASRELLNFSQRKGIDELLKKWDKMLSSINQVLDDAEDRQLTGNLEVKSWLEDLRNLAYDIDDLLDEFATKSAENKREAESSCSKARFLFPSCCFRLSPCEFMFDCEMRSKIKEMDRRLQEIISLKNNLSLRENNGKRSAYGQLNKLLPTTNLPEPGFVSREVEKRGILELLTGEEDDKTCVDLKVITIVGMGGVGKTALAQQVYNDARLTGYFDVKAWACVSDNFDVIAITKSILGTTNSHLSREDKDLNYLQDELKEKLAGKKFLVVLDDVWNENYENWTILLKPFQSGAKGSKIIITTRNLRVAEIAHAQPFTLDKLPPHACMTLFAFHALGVRNFDHHSHLKVLGMKIVEKCKGLPLAVKTLAGLLSFKVNAHEWEDILNSKIWHLPEESNNILPSLKLSYLHLPPNLRRCFAYCAIFPRDYEIERDALIHWWIAEGLLEGIEGKNSWNVGLKYFNELVSRSLLEKSSSSESRFLMHDLVNDLAKLVAGATHFDSREGDPNNASFARHASFISSSCIPSEKFKVYHGMKTLRSFVTLGRHSGPWDWYCVSQKVLSDLLLKLKYLRVLSLSHYHIREVPDCVGKLKHLRHLNLSYTDIKTLPKSIVGLYKLEALMLRGCKYLVDFPRDMKKLINLRFLDITDTKRLKAMPLDIGNLVGLEILSKFLVGTGNGLGLKELKNLKNLEGQLCILDLHKVREAEDAKDANLGMKEGICQLTMQWSKYFEHLRDEELEAKVLEFLCPHQNLEILKISYYGGLKLPSWLGNPPHVNLVHLHLCGCRRAKALPSLGQLSSLKELYIEGLNAIRRVGPEFYGVENPFSSLITLAFKKMPSWKDWSHYLGSEEGVLFPRLKHLVIQDCPLLIGRLPSQLGFLEKLEINSCPCMDPLPSVIGLPSLNGLNFGGCSEGLLNSLVDLTSLTNLSIKEVAELTCLNHVFASFLIKLEHLEMRSCQKLIRLWQDGDVISNLACLKSLLVKNCPEFISFEAGEGVMELPSNLETISLIDCVNLEKLPSKMHTLSSLRSLTVENCPKLVSFPETGIPTSVTSLTIKNCPTLQSLGSGFRIYLDEQSSNSSNNHGHMTSCLQVLEIGGCHSLPASPFSKGRFLSTTLKRLRIWQCRGVESLAEINVDPLQSLQEFQISNCENLRSLPQGLHTLSRLTFLWVNQCPALELECFPPLPPGISRFRLGKCPKIKSLPDQLHRLTCLRDLIIECCENITRFPDGGLPPQLERLEVRECWNMKQPVGQWLTPLTSLEELQIDGSAGGVVEGSDLLLPFPSSLLDLYISDMQEVERLASSLPRSLRGLWIENCPKLRDLPHDGLPPSLEILYIEDSDRLRERCSEPNGRYWPLLREIPGVEFAEI